MDKYGRNWSYGCAVLTAPALLAVITVAPVIVIPIEFALLVLWIWERYFLYPENRHDDGERSSPFVPCGGSLSCL